MRQPCKDPNQSKSAKPTNSPIQKPNKYPSPKAKRWGGARGEAGSSAAPSALKLALTLPLQSANKNPPRRKTTKPALAATPNSRRQSEKSEVPHQPWAPTRGYPQTAPSARTQNPSRKAKPTDFPFSMAFEISDKKAMEKGQGMRRQKKAVTRHEKTNPPRDNPNSVN